MMKADECSGLPKVHLPAGRAARRNALDKKMPRLFNKTFELLDYYKLPNKFCKLKTKDFPDLEKLVKNISNDKKRLSTGNRFIICDSIGHSSIKLINDSNLISNSFRCLFD